ncbi:MAG: histidine phosphatase family protein [Bacteroidetes bacterium]|nr:histidine phosphatase family protein [Bacteroidota bacterium]
MKKEIYLIRHGETDFNNLGIVQGRGVNSSINEKGISQAQQFYDVYKNTGFEKIYVSLLKRTEETISPFKQLNIPIEKHVGLDEISWGVHEGQNSGDTFKDFYRIIHLWTEGDLEAKMEAGESPLEVQNRQLEFLKVLKNATEQKVLICSHGRAIRILLCTMLNKPLNEMDTFPHHNVSLYKLNYEDDIFTLENFNDIAHLNG